MKSGAYKLTGHILWRDKYHHVGSTQARCEQGNPLDNFSAWKESSQLSVPGIHDTWSHQVHTSFGLPAAPQWRSEPVYVEHGCLTTTPKLNNHTVLDGWVLPGLVDVHSHIGLVAEGVATPEVTIRQAQKDAASGVLLVRDCGSPGDTRFVDEHFNVARILRCGHHLARPKRYIRNYGRELESDSFLPEAMVEEARAGSGWVKLVGDWIDRSEGADSTLRPLWSRQALADGISAVHEIGGRVTVHSFSHEAIDDLLDAGIDCIEHGTGLDDDHMSEIIARSIPVTPTVLQVDRFNDFADAAGTKYPVYASDMRRMFEQRYEHFARAWDAGVHFLPGTDAGGYQKHGVMPSELQAWLRFGATPADVIDCATWKARDYLGQPVLEEGAPADLVVYPDNPTASPCEDNPLGGLSVLSHPLFIVRGGISITPQVTQHEVED
ncbi:MAG: amidohydrolase family protein [Actinomycetaceae bacterium]|nr:amidohydrolase family protein [Actinomycetaceae bacterium]